MAETLTPNNREEHWLKGMVDGSTTLTPNKRKEYWYQEIINAQGGGGGGGYDLVLRCGDYIETSPTFVVASGSVSSTMEKARNGEPLNCAVVSLIDYGEYCGYDNFLITKITYADEEGAFLVIDAIYNAIPYEVGQYVTLALMKQYNNSVGVSLLLQEDGTIETTLLYGDE